MNTYCNSMSKAADGPVTRAFQAKHLAASLQPEALKASVSATSRFSKPSAELFNCVPSVEARHVSMVGLGRVSL